MEKRRNLDENNFDLFFEIRGGNFLYYLHHARQGRRGRNGKGWWLECEIIMNKRRISIHQTRGDDEQIGVAMVSMKSIQSLLVVCVYTLVPYDTSLNSVQVPYSIMIIHSTGGKNNESMD